MFVVVRAAVWGEPQQLSLSLDADGAHTVPMAMGDWGIEGFTCRAFGGKIFCCWHHRQSWALPVQLLAPSQDAGAARLPQLGIPAEPWSSHSFVCLPGIYSIFNPGSAPSHCPEALVNLSEATANNSSLCLLWEKVFLPDHN